MFFLLTFDSFSFHLNSGLGGVDIEASLLIRAVTAQTANHLTA